MKRTTTIRVLGDTWHVPRGFGRIYTDAARDDLALIRSGESSRMLDSVIDLLALVGYSATRMQVASWPLRQRVEAVVYATIEYARASDNPVRRHPRPRWLPVDPWQGLRIGTGALAEPTGTPISSVETAC